MILVWCLINLGKFSAVNHFRYFLCPMCSSCYSHYAYITLLVVIPQFLDILFLSGNAGGGVAFLFLSAFQFWQWVSAVGLKYSENHVENRCAVIQALLFHLQSTGSIDGA